MSRMWVMPLGAEALATDGDQLWYATPEGSGSVVAIASTEWSGLTVKPFGPALVKFDEPWQG